MLEPIRITNQPIASRRSRATSRAEYAVLYLEVLYDDRCLVDASTRPMDLTTAMAWRTAETLCSLGRGVLTAVVGRQIR